MSSTSDIHLKRVKDHVYSLKYDDAHIDYRYALEFFKQQFPCNPIGACSSMYQNGYFIRNYDWNYDDCVTFIVNKEAGDGRYASMGVAGGITQLTSDFVASKKYNVMYDILPYFLLDGINEMGLTCSVNVVPNGDLGTTSGTHQDVPGDEISVLMLVSVLLDRFSNAQDAVAWLSSSAKIYAPHNSRVDQELHILVSDSYDSYVVEFVENEVVIINAHYMTNFYLYGTEYDEDGHVIESSVTDYGTGLERYNIIADKLNNVSTKSDARNLARDLKFTLAYTDTNPDTVRYSEFNMNYGEPYGDLKVGSPREAYTPILNRVRELYAERDRKGDAKTWFTSHTSIYDIPMLSVDLYIDEDYTMPPVKAVLGSDVRYGISVDTIDIEFTKQIAEIDVDATTTAVLEFEI